MSDFKPFRPVKNNPNAFYLHDAYGITEDRRVKLSELMAQIHREQLNTITPVHHRIDRLADIADNAAEFAFCVHVDTIFLERHNQNLF